MASRSKKRKRRNKSRCEVIVREGFNLLRFRGQDMNELLKLVDIKLRGQKRRKVKW